jgi:hypothetical protein
MMASRSVVVTPEARVNAAFTRLGKHRQTRIASLAHSRSSRHRQDIELITMNAASALNASTATAFRQRACMAKSTRATKRAGATPVRARATTKTESSAAFEVRARSTRSIRARASPSRDRARLDARSRPRVAVARSRPRGRAKKTQRHPLLIHARDLDPDLVLAADRPR